MQKKGSVFLVMSGILMVSYLLVIASPNPPWPVDGSDNQTGSVTDSKYGGSIWSNTYVAYNVAWISQNWRNYRTYHWGRASKSTPGTSIYFKREWKHAATAGDGNEATIDTTSPWESDTSYATPIQVPDQNSPHNPYTAIRPGAGGGEVKAQVTVTVQ